MGQKFVLLASGLKKISEIQDIANRKAFRDRLTAKFTGVPTPFPAMIDGVNILGFNLNDNDGPLGEGTGTGNTGESQQVFLGELGQAFWRFPTRPNLRGHDACTKFPPNIRYELCLTFDTYDKLITFLTENPGNELQDHFHWVQYVAVTEPK